MSKRVAYLECLGGVSGNMLLGAALDAGVSPDDLAEVVKRLGLGDVSLSIEKGSSHGIAGTRVRVVYPEEHVHRHLADIKVILERSTLPARAKELAGEAFTRLAKAEAQIHGCGVEEVHFHEVGAVDAIVDIAGVCAAFELLGVEEVYGSPVPPGEGFVRCAHGVLPVPAPATLELLKGWPLTTERIPGEAVTPTGATLLTTLAQGYRGRPAMTVETIGYGFGTKEWPDRPNAVRLTIGRECERDLGGETPERVDDCVAVIETNIDDMNPEFFGRLCPGLLAQGALDVFYTPIQMKKGRPGVLLTVLCREEQVSAMTASIFAETTTLGVRIRKERRICQTRGAIQLEVLGLPIKVKMAVPAAGSSDWPNLAPEFEDCQRAAEASGRTVKEIYSRAVAASVAYLEAHQGSTKTYEE